MFQQLAAERDAKIVVAPGKCMAFDVEVMELEGVNFPPLLLRYRLEDQLLIRFPEIGAANFTVAAELFDRWQNVQQRAQFQQPVRRSLRRRDSLQRADETAHVPTRVFALGRIADETENVINHLLLVGRKIVQAVLGLLFPVEDAVVKRGAS